MTTTRILLAGDVTASGRTAQLLAEGRFQQLWNDTRNLVEGHDHSICNLETPLADYGRPIEKAGPSLRSPPALASLLSAWGFNAVSLANNHVMDFGPAGLEATLDACKAAGLASFGAGTDIQKANKPHRITSGMHRISFLAAAEEEFCIAGDSVAGVPPLRPIPMYRRIQEERGHADWVVVIFHGGNELYPLPRPGLQELCRFLISSGADAVVGHHPHLPGGYEVYEGKPIFYSVGNLLFDGNRKKPAGWHIGYFLSLEFRLGQCPGFSIVPYQQSLKDQPGVHLCGETESHRIKAEVEDSRQIIENCAELQLKWHRYCQNAGPRAVLPLLAWYNNRIYKKLLLMAERFHLLPTRHWTRASLNRVRCESHREEFIQWAEIRSRGRPENDVERQ